MAIDIKNHFSGWTHLNGVLLPARCTPATCSTIMPYFGCWLSVEYNGLLFACGASLGGALTLLVLAMFQSKHNIII